MKRISIIAIAALLTIGQGAWAWDGSGTSVDPYLIKTVADLNKLAADVNSGNNYSGVYFKLDVEDNLDYSNVTLTDGSNFTPIGWGDNSEGKPFSGIFDGDGKTISGITVNTPEAWGVGLFGYISKATIKNVTITSSSFTATGFVGAIVGCSDDVDQYAFPAIENCHVTNSVTVQATDYAAGGIIGIDNDNLTIKDCTCAATITSSDTESKPGGIIGIVLEDEYYMPTIVDSYYLGEMPAIGENGGATINITLLDDDSQVTAKNSKRISNYNGENVNIKLSSRKLWKDGSWNTLCLPFEIDDFTDTPLEGATVKTLTGTTFNETDKKLTLNFTEGNGLTAIEAGKPYILKWGDTTPNYIENPVFLDVTISNTEPTDIESTAADFVGIYSSFSTNGADKTILYMGADNKLYYPNTVVTIKSFRGYFQLNGINAGDVTTSSRIVLNFGDDETTGIGDATRLMDNGELIIDNWYSVDGVRLSGKPTRRGVYINNGRKVVIK